MLSTRFKKIVALTGTAILILLFCIPSVRAAASGGAEALLAQIVQNTGNIFSISQTEAQSLVDIDQSTTSAAPYSSANLWGNTNAIEQSAAMMVIELNSWLLQDTSQPTADLQSSLGALTNAMTQNQANVLSLQTQLTNDFFNAQGNVSQSTLPYANDLSFETLLGQPYFQPDPRNVNPPQGTPPVNPAYNYLKNASALTVTHPMPAASWRGNPQDLQRYSNYYNTIMAVQSFNAYVLSQLYEDSITGSPFSKAQTTLLTTASGSSWFSTVASENIGFVLRQILMFSSQSFVLLSQLLTTQNQLLQSQAMTNSLLVLLNQNNEALLIAKATGQVH